MKPYYEDAAVTIYHGDCREVMASLDAVDHIISDPPYLADVYVRMRNKDSAGGNRKHKIRGDSSLIAMKSGDIGSIDERIIAEVSAHAARIVWRWALFFSCAESIHLWREALVAAGMRYARTGIWVKPNAMPQMTGDRPGVGFETCTITHAKGRMKWNGGGHAATWTHNTSQGADRPDHPCPKPLSLMTELVGLFTDENELILDPFMGSGTTLRAAKDLGCRAIGIEIDEKYCEIAAERMSQSVLPLVEERAVHTESML